MHWLKSPIVILLGTQMLFTAGDLIARANMKQGGFTLANFATWWFTVYFLIRQVAMFGQLYVFTAVELGRSQAMFGAFSIVLSNVLGLLLLKEVLSAGAYAGVALAIAAFLVLALK
jgi:hypothetical protein